MERKKERNLKSRISNLLGQESSSDVEFRVGQPPETYLCHKVILAAGSEVFQTLFYGPFEQEGPVNVPDVTPKGFALMLQYLYSDTISFVDESDAFEAAYPAKKYMLPALFDACETYLMDNLALNPENVLETHEECSILGMGRLQERCLRYVSRNARKVFRSKSYARASEDTFQDVLRLDLMDIESEREIVEALWLWGRQRCAEDGIRCSAQNVRRYTGRFLKHVRFFAMTVEELVDALENCQLLDTSEELALLWNFAMPGTKRDPKVPSGLSTESRKRSINNSSRIQLPGQYLYDGNMTSFLIDEYLMKADIEVVTTGDDTSPPSITIVGAVIAFRPVPCYSDKDRTLEVELSVVNSTAGVRSGAKSRFVGEGFGENEDGEVRRSLILEDYVVIGEGQIGSLTVKVSGEGVRLMRRTEDAVTCVLGDATQLRLSFETNGGENDARRLMPIRELMAV